MQKEEKAFSLRQSHSGQKWCWGVGGGGGGIQVGGT